MDKLNLKHLNTLELPKILKRLSALCSCEDSAAAALEVLPESGLFYAQRALDETLRAYELIARFTSPSFGSIKNINNSLSRAGSGGVLTPSELLNVCEVLRVIRSLSQWHKNNALNCEEDPLSEYFNALVPNKFLEEKISSAIISEDEISDHASPALADIRRKIRRVSDSVREQLDRIIHSQTMRTYLQDGIITIRSGRYVVPVKAEHRSKISGLVHDTSASGSTVFIEPTAVVEANNTIRILESQEKNEIDRILAELSAICGEYARQTADGYSTLVKLDVIFCKAKLAYDMKATYPVLSDDGVTVLRRARHPLLDPKTVVPTDILLGGDFDTLVITGPNTGGKTVTLKTLGLLTLMAMCGMFVPAEESRLSVYDNVLCDIGDEQSIEQSLSTFSAHMTNIIEILKKADNRSLVLIDELGAGTDPAEGAALAVAILERLKKTGCRTAATTHYAELKMYALQTEGVKNGCCEFDVATLRPTYKLLIGMPGRSNAFAILSRLGMDEGIIARSKELVSNDFTRFEEVVEKLQQSHISLEKEKENIAEIKSAARLAEEKAKKRTETLEKEREKIISEARAQAENILSRTRSEANRLLGEMEDIKKTFNGDNAAEMLKKARADAKKGLGSIENAADPVDGKPMQDYTLPRPLKAGDTVELTDIGARGTVLETPDGSDYVNVQAGIIKTRVKLENLRLVEAENKQKRVPASQRTVHGVESRATRAVTSQIDLRGKRADEALIELDGFIDSAVMSGVSAVTVIHGKGTGALRDSVRQMLKTHRSVKSFRRGVYGEGEDGVTVAELV